MQTITLGKNGPKITQLGIGAWSWGDRLFWGYNKDYGAQEVKQAFIATLENGVSFFDTAEVYGFGESESLIGKFIKETGKRPQIATKYFPTPWRLTASSVSEALTASLHRLQVEQIELYQVHQPVSFLMSQKTLMNVLADEVHRGRIRAIGVSNYSANQMREAHQLLAERGVPLAVNQVNYSLANRKIETNGILDTARELGVVILAYSPLAQGLLTGKYTPSKPPAGVRQLDSRFGKEGLRKAAPLLKVIKILADQYKKTPAQIALNWLMAQGTVPIPGAKNATQAKENAGALGWSLAPEDVADLEKASRPWL